MAMNGNSGYIIGKVLNHKDSKATDIYARLSINPIRKAMEDTVNKFEQIRNGHNSSDKQAVSKEERIRQLEEELRLLKEDKSNE
jgi:hypothetical protein